MAALPETTQPTIEAIYKGYEDAQDTGYRYHLGASLIGKECERALWYDFRWATKAKFDGRMLRLFDTGNHEEARFVADLRRAGVEVWDRDPLDPAKQISCRDDFGHFGGSLDAVLLGVKEAPKTEHLGEFKTHNAKSFAKLKKEKVQKSKPRHYAQMQVYMHLKGFERGLYLAKDKDTDELYSERVYYDADFAIRLIAKARRVVTADRPPAKISNDPSWFECRFCDHHAVCHGGKVPERHCRSCLHSMPVEGGQWSCARLAEAGFDMPLSRETQERGCNKHLYIPDLIPGEQIGATETTVTYRMGDGSEWTDGV